MQSVAISIRHVGDVDDSKQSGLYQSVGVALLALKLSMAQRNAQNIGVTSVCHVRVHTATSDQVSMMR